MSDGRRSRKRGLLRDSSSTSVAALLAVASGFLLDVVIAARFGAGGATDAYFAATRVPLGLGTIATVAANQAIMPTIVTWRRRFDPDLARGLTWQMFMVVTAGAGVLALVGMLVAEPLVAMVAPGFSAETQQLTARLMVIMFAAVPPIMGGEVLRAALNARRRFVLPAASNLALNGTAVAILLVWRGDIELVARGYLAGAVLRLAVLWVAAGRASLGMRWTGWGDVELRAAMALCGRPALGAALNPVARLGEQVVVSFLPAGALTIVNYGYRLISAIGGTVFFRSVMVTLMPGMTEAATDRDWRRVRRLSGRGVSLMLLVAVPLMLLLVGLAQPAVALVFVRDSFTSADASLLGAVLVVYAFSLPASGVQRALLAPMYASLDTRTPLVNTAVGMGANLLLVAVFVRLAPTVTLALMGVALAYVLAQFVNVIHAVMALRRIDRLPIVDRALLRHTLVVPTLAGILVLAGGRWLIMEPAGDGWWPRMGQVAGIATLAVLPYAGRIGAVRALLGGRSQGGSP